MSSRSIRRCGAVMKMEDLSKKTGISTRALHDIRAVVKQYVSGKKMYGHYWNLI